MSCACNAYARLQLGVMVIVGLTASAPPAVEAAEAVKVVEAVEVAGAAGTAQPLGATEGPAVARAVRVNPHPPAIDGRLDDPVWQGLKLPLLGSFTQSEPLEGAAPSESTQVAFVYDDDALYVAFWNYDRRPGDVRRQLVRRDRWAETDQVAVMIDSYHDHQTGYRFEVSAAGVQRDQRISNDGELDTSWDGVWHSAVRAEPWGWSAELKIPYHCLRFNAAAEQTWGVNLERYLSRQQETSHWCFTPSAEGGYVSRFGHLTGLRGIKPARHLELLPYSVSRVRLEPEHPGNPDGRDFAGDIGLDLKYGLSPNLIFDATINPDFGQVELDSPVLNLSAFETWYPEKRPFFLEGADIFATPFDLFYSRRIGHAPTQWPGDADYYTDRPDGTTILLAGKVTGRVTERTTLGVLNAYTPEEVADFVDTEGERRSAVVEPRSNYGVFRLKRDVLRSSHVGVMGTLASRDHRHPAATGGLDWNLKTHDGAYGVDGQVVGSRVDAEDAGFGWTATFSELAGEHLRASVTGTVRDPHLRINDLGYVSRNDFRQVNLWVQYRTQTPWAFFRRTYHDFGANLAHNYAGDNIGRSVNYNTSLEFTSGWSLSGGVGASAPDYDDIETRGNGLWKYPKAWSWWANLRTDPRKPVSLTLNPGSGNSRNGSWWAHYTGIELRPRESLEVSLGANYYRAFNETRWIDNLTDPDTGENVAVFADLDFDKVTPRFSGSWTLSPTLSWQMSASMLLSGLDFGDYRRYEGNGEIGRAHV